MIPLPSKLHSAIGIVVLGLAFYGYKRYSKFMTKKRGVAAQRYMVISVKTQQKDYRVKDIDEAIKRAYALMQKKPPSEYYKKHCEKSLADIQRLKKYNVDMMGQLFVQKQISNDLQKEARETEICLNSANIHLSRLDVLIQRAKDICEILSKD